MRVPDTAHTSRPWRIHELAHDFRVEDVWALPTPGGPDDLARLVRQFTSAGSGSVPPFSGVTRTLFSIRWKVGELLGWDQPGSSVGARVQTLRDRLPVDLRDMPPGPDLRPTVPLTSVYQTHDEWAAEMANRTVHAVMHIGRVPDETGGYRGEMAVLVKPNGLFGKVYMGAIRPFRRLIVDPALIRMIGRRWQMRGAA